MQRAIRLWRLSLHLYERWTRFRYFNWAVKGIFVSLLIALLYYDLTSRNNLPDLWNAFLAHLEGANWLWLTAVFVLLPFNWLAETEKWLQFVRHNEPMSRQRALLAVLAGVSLSLFTPNRVGEFGGRILFVRPENRWHATVANLVGNFAQYMVLLGIGLLGTIYTLQRFNLVEPWFGQLFVTAAIIGLGLMIWVYFHIEHVIFFVRGIPILKPLHFVWKYFNLSILREFNRRELLDMIRWAAIRYLIYTTQYFCLLHFFGIPVDIIGGFAGIAALFLLQTSIPMPPVAGLMARGNLAVLLWEQYGANELSSLAATFSLWVINLILPALIGAFGILYVNIGKSTDYDHTTAYNDQTTPVAPVSSTADH